MKNSAAYIETQTIKRVQEGDREAFRLLVDAYKDLSLSLACSIVKDHALAEDIVQEAFIKVFQKIKSFRFQSGFATWLYRIVVNTSYNALKKQKYHHDLDTLTKLPPEAVSTAVDFYSLQETEQKYYIQKALEQLRPDEALILRLFYLCELKISEIIEITSFSKSKIKVDLHRGRQQLAFTLKQILGTEIHDLL